MIDRFKVGDKLAFLHRDEWLLGKVMSKDVSYTHNSVYNVLADGFSWRIADSWALTYDEYLAAQ